MLKPGKGAIGTSRETIFGTRVTFTCPMGQEFATGKSKIMTECLPGGSWTVSYIPDCQGEFVDVERKAFVFIRVYARIYRTGVSEIIVSFHKLEPWDWKCGGCITFAGLVHTKYTCIFFSSSK